MLKNFLSGRPERPYHSRSSSALGFSVLMFLSSYVIPLFLSHSVAFLQVLHDG